MKLQLKAAYLCGVAVSVLLSAAGAHAQDVPAKYTAAALMTQKQYAQACDLLKTSYGDASNDTDVLRLQAQCNVAQKKYADAEKYYYRITQVAPEQNGARAELGYVYIAQGRDAEAQKTFQSVLSNKPGVELERRLVETLDAMKNRQARPVGKPWYFRIEAAGVYDSNINAGPDSSQILIFNLPFSLSGSSMPTESFGYSLTAEGGYEHRINENVSIVAQASVSRIDYEENGDFDSNAAGVSVGPTYRDGKFTASVAPAFNFQTLDGDMYRKSYGVAGRTAYQVDEPTSVFTTASYFKNKYDDNDARDSDAYAVMPGIAYQIDEATQVSGAYQLRTEDADSDIYSNLSHGPRLAVSHSLTADLNVSATYGYTAANYDGRQSAFGNVKRDDDIHNVGVRADYSLTPATGVEGLVATARYNYIDTKSNIDIYDYDRHQATLGVSKTW